MSMTRVQEFTDRYRAYQRDLCGSEQAARLVEYLQRKSPDAIQLVRIDGDRLPVVLFRKRDWQDGLIYAFVSAEELTVYWSTFHTHVTVGGGELHSLTEREEQQLEQLEADQASDAQIERVRWQITLRILLEVIAGVSKPPS